MKTDRFVKVMFLIVVSFLLLNCGNHVIDSVGNAKQPPQKVIDVFIDKTKEICGSKVLECKDIKVGFYYDDPVSDAEKANGIEMKGTVGIHYISRPKTSEKWIDDTFYRRFILRKTGEMEIKSL
jgi:hypothetical protein